MSIRPPSWFLPLLAILAWNSGVASADPKPSSRQSELERLSWRYDPARTFAGKEVVIYATVRNFGTDALGLNYFEVTVRRWMFIPARKHIPAESNRLRFLFPSCANPDQFRERDDLLLGFMMDDLKGPYVQLSTCPQLLKVDDHGVYKPLGVDVDQLGSVLGCDDGGKRLRFKRALPDSTATNETKQP